MKSIEGDNIKNVRLVGLEFTKNGLSWPVSFASDGTVEILNLLSAITGAKDQIVILDEPALNLHPQFQTSFAQLMNEESRNRANQFLVITHSPHLLDLSHLGQTFRISLTSEGSKLFYPNISSLPDKEWEKIKKEFLRNPNIRASLFSKGVILFEGNQEEAALPIWFRKLGLDLDSHDIAFYSVDSDTAFDLNARAIDLWSMNFVIICDNMAHSTLEEKFGYKVLRMKHNDFDEMLKEAYPTEHERAVGIIRSRKNNHSPAVARLVAEETDPPDEVKNLAKAIKRVFGIS